jgi:hypothetical protein
VRTVSSVKLKKSVRLATTEKPIAIQGLSKVSPQTVMYTICLNASHIANGRESGSRELRQWMKPKIVYDSESWIPNRLGLLVHMPEKNDTCWENLRLLLGDKPFVGVLRPRLEKVGQSFPWCSVLATTEEEGNEKSPLRRGKAAIILACEAQGNFPASVPLLVVRRF